MPIINADPDKTLDNVVDMLNDKIARMHDDMTAAYNVPEAERDNAKVALLNYRAEILRSAIGLINLV